MAEVKEINVGQVGHKFIGRAHAYAYNNVRMFFNPPLAPVKKVLCGLEEDLPEFAEKWGYEEWTHDWKDVVGRDDIGIIDICAPSKIHKQLAIAAAEAGKHVFCEKPLAMNLADAREMTKAVKDAGVVNTIGFNYRKVPAIALAKQIIESGELGEIYQFRGLYAQDFLIDPGYPLAWRLRKKEAGGGSAWDLGAHVVDLARFLVGEVDSVVGNQETFIKERPIAVVEDGLYAEPGEEKGEVTVDDASHCLVKFKDGPIGIMEETRYGSGHRNQNRIEVFGSKGGIVWNGIEKMNEIDFYNHQDPDHEQGFKTIQVSEPVHPYMSAYWPPGHIIGFGETFIHEVLDFVNAINEGKSDSPNFEDGLRAQEILVAIDESVKRKSWVSISEMQK